MMNDVEAIEWKPPRRPWQLEFRSSKGFIIATVCTAIFTVRLQSHFHFQLASH
jgi:hypothetical protein